MYSIKNEFQERRLKKERRRNRELRRAQRRQARIDAGLVPSSRDTPKKKASESVSRNALKDKFSTTGNIEFVVKKGEEGVTSCTYLVIPLSVSPLINPESLIKCISPVSWDIHQHSSIEPNKTQSTSLPHTKTSTMLNEPIEMSLFGWKRPYQPPTAEEAITRFQSTNISSRITRGLISIV